MTTSTIQSPSGTPVRSDALLTFLEGFAAGFERGQSAASAYECGHGSWWSVQDIQAAGEDAWQDADCNNANIATPTSARDENPASAVGD